MTVFSVFLPYRNLDCNLTVYTGTQLLGDALGFFDRVSFSFSTEVIYTIYISTDKPHVELWRQRVGAMSKLDGIRRAIAMSMSRLDAF